MNICIVAGARPNFVKIAPIVRAIEKAQAEGKDVAFDVVYTGRECDATLEKSLYEDLQIKQPQVYLGVESDNLNELTGKVMYAFEEYLHTHPTDVVIVVDDLASTMAVSIVAKKQGLLLAHLVAGTRSFDINMPKEINRLVIDGLSDLLFTAGIQSSGIATREGAESSKIYMVGNILMDSLRFNLPRFTRPEILDTLQLPEQSYLVFTLNRHALLSNEQKLERLLCAMLDAAGDCKVIAPLREVAAKTVRKLVGNYSNLVLCEPMSYLDFGYLTRHAQGIITDSGNVAEEATFNGVPCATLNSYTEHLDTVNVGTNVLVGEDAHRLSQAVELMIRHEWKKGSLPERWDGRSAERIVHILLNR